MRVYIYFNLHKKCWSVRALSGPDKGRVKYHAQSFRVEDVTFKVSAAGRRRVLREQRKNVHAGIVGTLVSWVDLDGDVGSLTPFVPLDSGIPVTYNPYVSGSFYTRDIWEQPVKHAGVVSAVGRYVIAQTLQ